MKKIFLIVAVIVIVFGGWLIWRNRTFSNSKPSTVLESLERKFQESKTDSQNNIEVVVTPVELSIGKPAIFAVSFTTHEGNLVFDLAETSVLEIDGKTYKAESWDGASGGHHLDSTLVFSRLENKPEKVVLKMENVAGANRTFTWE